MLKYCSHSVPVLIRAAERLPGAFGVARVPYVQSPYPAALVVVCRDPGYKLGADFCKVLLWSRAFPISCRSARS
jgi:hypothetical protein